MNKPASELIALADEAKGILKYSGTEHFAVWQANNFIVKVEPVLRRLAANQSGSERAGVDVLLDRVVKFDECATAEPTLRWMLRDYYDSRLPDETDLMDDYTARFVAALATPPAQPALAWPKEEVSPGQFADVDPAVLNRPLFGCKRAGGFVDTSCLAPCDCDRTMRLDRPSEPHGKPDGAVREAETAFQRLAADCHRSKWHFDINEENAPNVYEARRLVRKAFDELQRIGNIAMHERDALHSPKIAAAIDRLDVKAEAKSQEPEAVAIKPLEWVHIPGGRATSERHDAITLAGVYSVYLRDNGDVQWAIDHSASVNSADGLSRAKAAAQADYEQRIRSALIHPTIKPEASAVSVDAIRAALSPFIGRESRERKEEYEREEIEAAIRSGGKQP